MFKVANLAGMMMDIAVVLGRSHVPIHVLLRMGRGAVIELEATENDTVEILANDMPIARGQIVVTGTRISVEITEVLRRPAVISEPGASIDQSGAAEAASEDVNMAL
jgi:flagellar motor switch protein FliN